MIKVAGHMREGSVFPQPLNIFIDDLLCKIYAISDKISIGHYSCNVFACADDITVMCATVLGFHSSIDRVRIEMEV